MSFDENMFFRYAEDGIPSFRVYGWDGPAFTYGAGQHPEGQLDLERCSRDGVRVAKRITGGGVLFHHREITYSLVCSKEDIGEDERSLVSYRQVCAFLIEFYKSLGLEPRFALEAEGFRDKSLPHPLCSASHEKYDIVIGRRKIGGNAQKRRRRVVFQHGSIPVAIDWSIPSRYVLDMPEGISSGATSLEEELKSVPESRELERLLIDSFAAAYGVDFLKEGEVEGERNVCFVTQGI